MRNMLVYLAACMLCMAAATGIAISGLFLDVLRADTSVQTVYFAAVMGPMLAALWFELRAFRPE